MRAHAAHATPNPNYRRGKASKTTTGVAFVSHAETHQVRIAARQQDARFLCSRISRNGVFACHVWQKHGMLANSAMGKETFHERWLLTKLSDNGTLIFFTVDETLRHLR
jgi:hypothetical protein